MMVRDYASDRVDPHPTAELIKCLDFSHQMHLEFYGDVCGQIDGGLV